MAGIIKLWHGFLVAAAMIGTQTAFAASPQPIKIGVSIAESLPGSVSQGKQVKEGLELATDLMNKAGGVLGRPLKLIIENDQGLPARGRSAVEKLITEDHVAAISGSHQSSVCLAELPVVHHYDIPFLNTNCCSDAVPTAGYSARPCGACTASTGKLRSNLTGAA
ncbi:MAG: ABC transporter substrate-binding protein [Acetobacteraceae bacterium]